MDKGVTLEQCGWEKFQEREVKGDSVMLCIDSGYPLPHLG